jgi:hypothetical protein
MVTHQTNEKRHFASRIPLPGIPLLPGVQGTLACKSKGELLVIMIQIILFQKNSCQAKIKMLKWQKTGKREDSLNFCATKNIPMA